MDQLNEQFASIYPFIKKQARGNEDLAQEMAVFVWKYLPNYDPSRGQLTTFVGQICKSASILYWLRFNRKVKTKKFANEPTSDYRQAPKLNTEKVLNKIKEVLTPREYDCWTRSKLEDVRLKEIGETHGISKQRVFTIIKDAEVKIDGICWGEIEY